MHRYYQTGYYWHREGKEAEWQIVRLHRLHTTAPLSVLFIGRAAEGMGCGLPIEKLHGELLGPITDPSMKNVLAFQKR